MDGEAKCELFIVHSQIVPRGCASRLRVPRVFLPKLPRPRGQYGIPVCGFRMKPAVLSTIPCLNCELLSVIAEAPPPKWQLIEEAG